MFTFFFHFFCVCYFGQLSWRMSLWDRDQDRDPLQHLNLMIRLGLMAKQFQGRETIPFVCIVKNIQLEVNYSTKRAFGCIKGNVATCNRVPNEVKWQMKQLLTEWKSNQMRKTTINCEIEVLMAIMLQMKRRKKLKQEFHILQILVQGPLETNQVKDPRKEKCKIFSLQ